MAHSAVEACVNAKTLLPVVSWKSPWPWKPEKLENGVPTGN